MTTVLVVDDDEQLRKLSNEVLTLEGFNVLLASDGLEALSIIQSTRVDFLLTDFRMPNMDGMELIAELRGRGFLLPILLLSAYYNEHVQVPQDVYVLRKPIEPDRLVTAVSNLLSNSNSRYI